MKLVIGGYAQGKLNYVLQKYDMETSKIWDGEIPENKGEQNSIVINHLHHWIKSRIAKGGCPEEEIFAFVENCPNCVIISDEVVKVGDKKNLERLYKELINKDWFMTLLDLEDYIKVKDKMFEDYEDRAKWQSMMLVNIAKAGFFSSDRTIEEYDRDIWHLRESVKNS